MLVETYEVEESKDEMALLAADSEAMELINKLGLDGQKSLSDADTDTRFPYRKMTREEGLVYGLLCPVKTPIEKYRDGLIPLRVLQVAAYAKETDFLDSITVWHPENADIKDPVLVGSKKVKTGPGEYQYNTELYLLARWGAELPSFDEMRKLAVKMWVNTSKVKLKAIQMEIENAIRNVESFADNGLIPKMSESPYFSFSL